MRDPSFRCSPSHPWKLPQSRHHSVSSSQPTSRTASHPQFDPSSYFLLFLVSLICSSTEYTSSEGPPLPSCISARLFPYAWERRGPSIQWSSGYQYLFIGGDIWAGILIYNQVVTSATSCLVFFIFVWFLRFSYFLFVFFWRCITYFEYH